MWYEALPSMVIIVAGLYFPQVAAWHLNYAVFGNHFRRQQIHAFEFEMFRRDTRIDGAPWKLRGLENIPDE